jgi:hypothetical protein
MTRSGHSSYATTRRYVDLAGERFRGEADRLEQRLWGGPVEKSGRNPADDRAADATENTAMPHG